MDKKRAFSRIVFLDYLRIFAFVNVIIAHKFYDNFSNYINESAISIAIKKTLLFLLQAFHGGGVGVVVFFFISGYIITFVLKSEDSKTFFIKRLFRIYPLYALAVFLQVILEFNTKSVVPSFTVLIQQLLLVGDFFNTPYALWGVEWTLRVEIMFYIYMGIIKKVGIFDDKKHLLPPIYIVTAILIALFSPLPSAEGWSQGTFSIYSALLFIGSLIYLYEDKTSNLTTIALTSIFILALHYHLMSSYTPQWLNSHFAAIAISIFILSWKLRLKLPIIAPVLFLSDLTYSIYLFHNWPWDSIKSFYEKLSIKVLHPDLQALITIFIISYIMLKLVEKPFIKIGAKMVKGKLILASSQKS